MSEIHKDVAEARNLLGVIQTSGEEMKATGNHAVWNAVLHAFNNWAIHSGGLSTLLYLLDERDKDITRWHDLWESAERTAADKAAECERLREALEYYVCDPPHCNAPKLGNGQCVRDDVGTCGKIAHAALSPDTFTAELGDP